MPDPFVILQAMAAAAIAAAAILLASTARKRPADAGRAPLGWPFAIGVGFVIGAVALGQRPGSLPGTDKDRLLLLVMPMVMITETVLAAARPNTPWQWVTRLAMAAAIVPILLHGTIYLARPGFASADTWSTADRVMILGGIAMMLVTQWLSMLTLQERGRSTVIWWALAVISIIAGFTTMLTGYMSAGMLGLPLAAVCGTAAVVGSAAPGRTAAGGLVVALACLGSILVRGRFFGALSTPLALMLAAAPLLCWITECRPFRAALPPRYGGGDN